MKIIAVIGGEISGIEHIGSTAIKGMKAKPIMIIDIMVGVQDLQEVPQFVKSLEKIEFEYVPKPEWSDRKFFRKGEWGQGTCHLHICEIDSMEWKEKLWFRDYLRANPQVANEYIAVKKDLAARYIQDKTNIYKGKSAFYKKCN